MSVQKLFALLVAIAVLLAPAFTQAGAAMAAVPDHHMQMMEMGHCQSPPGSDHDKATGKSCCISMCMALAVVPTTPVMEKTRRPAVMASAVPKFRLAFLGEIATPPPRLA